MVAALLRVLHSGIQDSRLLSPKGQPNVAGLDLKLRQDGVAEGFGGDAGAVRDEKNGALGHGGGGDVGVESWLRNWRWGGDRKAVRGRRIGPYNGPIIRTPPAPARSMHASRPQAQAQDRLFASAAGSPAPSVLPRRRPTLAGGASPFLNSGAPPCLHVSRRPHWSCPLKI